MINYYIIQNKIRNGAMNFHKDHKIISFLLLFVQALPSLLKQGAKTASKIDHQSDGCHMLISHKIAPSFGLLGYLLWIYETF